MIKQHIIEMEIMEPLAQVAKKAYFDGDLIHAERCYRSLLKNSPESAPINGAIGSVLLDQRRYTEAASFFRKANAIVPNDANITYSLGQCYYYQLDYDEALYWYKITLALQPSMFSAHNSMAAIYGLHRAYHRARQHLVKALEIKPESAVAHFNLGILQCETGNLDQGCALLRKSIQLDPNKSMKYSALLFHLHYQSRLEKEFLYNKHREWNKKYAASLCERIKHRNSKVPNRRLKIAYISPDFHMHSVSVLFVGILKSHHRDQYEIFCYSDGEISDGMSVTLKKMADHWCDINHKSDAYVLQRIQEDEIDILVDLAGHTGDNRLQMMSYKPAPIQVTYLGYPNTTGLDAINYRLTDEWADPVEEKGQYYSEKLIRIPDGFLCFQPAVNIPDVAPAPFNKNGYITFGSFNNLQKINTQVISLWASVLNSVNNSRIVLKARGLDDDDARQRIFSEFSQLEVVAERITLLNYEENIGDHLVNYSLIDIALETFPYNGTVTTCEALWMGVPVITLRGDMHISRVGESIMYQAGLPDLIAETSENYIKIATDISNNPELINHLRGNLRPHLAHSKLMDAKGFIGHLESIYRDMWHCYCEN